MTEKLTTCPACGSGNLDNSVYCCQCGLPMREGIPFRCRTTPWPFILLMSLVLAVMMTVGLQLFHSCRQEEAGGGKAGVNSSVPASEDTLPRTAPGVEGPPTVPGTFSAGDGTGRERPPLTGGTVHIFSREANLIAEIPAAVVNGTWLALPVRPCIGGVKWLFSTGHGKEVPVAGGIWSRGDSVGFWQLAGSSDYPSPELTAWQPEMPVRLLLFASGEITGEMLLIPERQEGIFDYCRLPHPLGPGIFLQGGSAVGWSFGDMLPGCYMWTLPPDAALEHEISVQEFYNDTFSGGREDFFSRALAMDSDIPPLVQLQMFTEGFWYPPKLSAEYTPDHLSREVVYPYIIQLVDYIMNQEQYGEIARLADEPLLWEMRNPKLLTAVTRAIQKTYGTESAVTFLEGPGADIIRSSETADPYLDRLLVDLYSAWLTSLLENGEIRKGWQVFNRARSRFGDSLEIHLLGVELALADGDWAEAEALLYRKKYPPGFREKMMLLADRISRIKGRENQIVISFQPGARQIPVSAILDAVLEHDFLIDTGSSYVTIPYAAVQALGLEDQVSEQPQEVQTAGGPVYANTVVIPSIELQGWVVNDVRALIMDLPNRPGMGLLGLNYLDRFRMDLQSDRGILILEPQ
jgi:clan AA aspartic protease (TIGR02281 family)